MFDKKITPIYQRALEPLGRFLVSKKVSADTITVAGFMLGVFAIPMIIKGYFFCALIFIILNRTLDGLDGIIARKTFTSDRGAFLDFTLDCVFYAMVPIGFAFNNLEHNAMPTLLLLGSFIGTSVSFLSFSIIAERKGIYIKNSEEKGIYYVNSFMEGTETIVFFVLMCLFPIHYKFFAYLFAFGCLITLIIRLRTAWVHFPKNTNKF